MELTKKDVKEFQDLYKSKFGKEIDAQTARHKLTMLVRQMAVIHQPIKKEQLEELARRDAMKDDAKALAELTYDVYKEKKRKEL